MPEKLHELQRLLLIEAVRYNVLPLDDNLAARLNSDAAGRPVLNKGSSQILFGSMGRLSENSVLNIKNKSHSVTAEIVVPQTGAEGVIIAQGGNIGGRRRAASSSTVTTCSAFNSSTPNQAACCLRENTWSVWSLLTLTLAAALARAARRPCSWMAKRRRG